jgi:hypothetical protein
MERERERERERRARRERTGNPNGGRRDQVRKKCGLEGLEVISSVQIREQVKGKVIQWVIMCSQLRLIHDDGGRIEGR